MSKNRLYLDIHALQVLPPSCVNRDDTGTPKTCVYGGKTRARVSSQCWKRAARLYMKENSRVEIGIRTRKIVSELSRLLGKYGFSGEEADKAAAEGAKAAGVASDKDDAKSVLAFFSESEIDSLARIIAKHKEEFIALSPDKEENKKDKKQQKGSKKEIPKTTKKLLKDAVMAAPSSDILLFGRMFASDPSLEYDAACQVAHAISVNEARTEYDYFTAVDDIPDADNSGSAHIDTKQYCDPIFYRYANVNLSETSELIRMDRDNAAEIAAAFAEAFILSMPSGSWNAYANATLPDYIMIVLRDDRPVSFAPAFIEVVKSANFEKEAEEKLQEYADKISTNYGGPVLTLTLREKPFQGIIDEMKEQIQRRIDDDNAAS